VPGKPPGPTAPGVTTGSRTGMGGNGCAASVAGRAEGSGGIVAPVGGPAGRGGASGKPPAWRASGTHHPEGGPSGSGGTGGTGPDGGPAGAGPLPGACDPCVPSLSMSSPLTCRSVVPSRAARVDRRSRLNLVSSRALRMAQTSCTRISAGRQSHHGAMSHSHPATSRSLMQSNPRAPRSARPNVASPSPPAAAPTPRRDPLRRAAQHPASPAARATPFTRRRVPVPRGPVPTPRTRRSPQYYSVPGGARPSPCSTEDNRHAPLLPNGASRPVVAPPSLRTGTGAEREHRRRRADAPGRASRCQRRSPEPGSRVSTARITDPPGPQEPP
jgi:hypothetical protein